jgi:hypothetical protein
VLSIIPERPGKTDAPLNNKSQSNTNKAVGLLKNGIGRATQIDPEASVSKAYKFLTSLNPP